MKQREDGSDRRGIVFSILFFDFKPLLGFQVSNELTQVNFNLFHAFMNLGQIDLGTCERRQQPPLLGLADFKVRFDRRDLDSAPEIHAAILREDCAGEKVPGECENGCDSGLESMPELLRKIHLDLSRDSQ